MTLDYRPTAYSTPDLMVEAYHLDNYVAYFPIRLHFNWGWNGNYNGFYLDNDIVNPFGNFIKNRNDLLIRPIK